MSADDPAVRLALVRRELEQLSFVAHRDLCAALPAIEPHGAEQTARWAETGRDLFLHDREAGKAFLRASPGLAHAAACIDIWTEQARSFLGIRGSWKALTAYLAAWAEVVAVLGPDDGRAFAQAGIGWMRQGVEAGEIFFQTPVADWADGRGYEGVREILDPLTELAVTRAVPPGLALRGAITVRGLLGPGALVPWLTRGADILKSGRLRGEAFFRLEGPESEEALAAILPGFKTSDHERFLTLFVRAACGFTPALAPRGLALGRPAFIETDGRTLFVPPAFPSSEHALAAFLHHAGHLRFGTYDGAAIARLFREAGMEHPPLDAEQRITWRPLFALFGDDLLRFQALFDLCEDLRVDARVQALVPNHIPRLLRLAHERPAGPAAAYFDMARTTLASLMGGRGVPPPWTELLAADADLVTSWRLARALYKDGHLPALAIPDRDHLYLPGRSPNHQRPVYPRSAARPEGPETDEQEGGAVAESAATRPAPVSPGQDPDMEIPPEDTSGSGGRVGVGRPQPAQTARRLRRLAPAGAGIPYPEWDYRDQAYRRDWTRVIERDLSERDGACAAALLARHGNVLARLKRAIQAEKPRRLTPVRRQREGEELDLDAVVEYVADRRTGARPEPAIYRRRQVTRRDTAVLLLADLSTSIMQPLEDGSGRVVDRMKAALLLFAKGLESLGDPYAIAGFASKYRDAVSYYPIKDFGQTLTADTEAVLGGLSGRLATRMGAAIRHASARLRSAPGGRRLLLILSDGRPADYDDGGDERYLHEDTRMAVKEAQDAGVHAFCITLDAQGGPYLERIFGRGHFLVVGGLDELPRRLPEVYLRLRKGAA